MAKKQENKTNAMRILERMGIAYESLDYECDEFTDGLEIADKLGLAYDEVFKTLVTVGSDGQHYVFVIPVAEELDFKKCARAVGVKSIQMIHVKELFDLTGYVRGGCTSVGMKKQFVTRIDETAQLFDKIYVSAGRIGTQIHLDPEDLLRAAQAEYAELTKD
ncbi:MAG: Cys-tRNA(Pro) deacylase [Firmicutes bacterium]|nr:Cys-tRNA(Pro) deacylase [Bacillota bacterium]